MAITSHFCSPSPSSSRPFSVPYLSLCLFFTAFRFFQLRLLLSFRFFSYTFYFSLALLPPYPLFLSVRLAASAFFLSASFSLNISQALFVSLSLPASCLVSSIIPLYLSFPFLLPVFTSPVINLLLALPLRLSPSPPPTSKALDPMLYASDSGLETLYCVHRFRPSYCCLARSLAVIRTAGLASNGLRCRICC